MKKNDFLGLDPFWEFKKQLEVMKEDLLGINERVVEPVVINDSCLNMRKYEVGEIDLSLFSPPYLNCFDFFEIYKTELWLGDFIKSYKDLRELRKKALISNLNADLEVKKKDGNRSAILDEIIFRLEKKRLWDVRIPKMVDGYFYQMDKVLKSIFRRTKKGGWCVMVVGNSAYGNLVIPTDILLAEIGKKVGFKVEEIIVARKNETSSQQQKKLGRYLEYMRESIVMLRR